MYAPHTQGELWGRVSGPAGLAVGSPAHAQTSVVPSSYTATTGEGLAQGGNFNYFDDRGMQLTDGVTGVNGWTAKMGNGPAYEWVGWKTANPTFTFSFAQNVTIRSVSIGFNRTESAGIFIPPNVTIGGTAFTLAPDALVNGYSWMRSSSARRSPRPPRPSPLHCSLTVPPSHGEGGTVFLSCAGFLSCVGEGSLTRAARAPSVIADASSVGQTPLSYKTSPSQSVKRTSSARAA